MSAGYSGSLGMAKTFGSVHLHATDQAEQPALVVGGFSCHSGIHTIFVEQPQPIAGQPHYATACGCYQIYFDPANQCKQTRNTTVRVAILRGHV